MRVLAAASWLALAAACGGAEPRPELPYTCPPCGMGMPADSELVEVEGEQYAACNERCAGLVREDPAAFAEHAVPRN